MATPTGKERRHEHRPTDLSRGAWKEAVERLLMEDGGKRARAYATAQRSEHDLVMRIPITFHVRFTREGETLAAAGDVDCACTIFQDEDGEVCICEGPCPDFPDICDEGPVFTEKV
jgi:hypothetical protein